MAPPPGGFTDRDFGDTRRPRRRERTRLGTVAWNGRVLLDPATALDRTLLNRAREELYLRLDRHCNGHGYTIDSATVAWDSWIVDETGLTQIELRAMLIPRTDGEWGSIHAAIAEDEADRAAAAKAHDAVHDGLDRLRSAREWWLAHPPPKRSEAARGPSTAASDPL